jgi:hypothetical protein
MADGLESESVSHSLDSESLTGIAVSWACEMRLCDKPESVGWVEYIEGCNSKEQQC